MLKLNSDYSDYTSESDENYPLGKAVNASASDAYDGTPLLESFMNDLNAAHIAMYKKAYGNTTGISGEADTQLSSQFADAVDKFVSDKVDTHDALRGVDAHGATADATPGQIITRDSNGNASVASPTEDSHIANKLYVDDNARPVFYKTQAEYDAMTSDERKGKFFVITDATGDDHTILNDDTTATDTTWSSSKITNNLNDSLAKFTNLPQSSANKWYEYSSTGTGFFTHHYEGQDVDAYKLPSAYVEVYVLRKANTRGSAIAIDWRTSSPNIWFCQLHDDNNTDNWGDWRKLASNIVTQTITATTSANGNANLYLSLDNVKLLSIYETDTAETVVHPYAGDSTWYVHCTKDNSAGDIVANTSLTFVVTYLES